MASATYLSNPVLTINSVDLTDMCTAATLTYLVEALEDTAFGTNSRSYTAGLANNEVTLTMYASFAATETYATLQPLVPFVDSAMHMVGRRFVRTWYYLRTFVQVSYTSLS